MTAAWVASSAPLFLLPFAVVGVLALASIEKIGRASTPVAEPDAPAGTASLPRTPQGRAL